MDLLTRLRDQFGHEAFRPGQERIIRDLLEQRDVLAVLPTGHGKSLPFQLAAQLVPGLTVVVSPLLALMKDQVESVAGLGLEVRSISGSPPDSHLGELIGTGPGLVYVTPERFENDAFVDELSRRDISVLVVDEAHSISQWGHSFRPAYLSLGGILQRVRPRPVVLALTATATPWVRADIIQRLDLNAPDVVVHGIDRPNLFFEVERVEEERLDKRVLQELLLDQAAEGGELGDLMRGSGIVYAATTRAAEDTAGWLREWGIAADAYHGRRKKADRDRIQEAFMSGELRVIAATNAFGMGVDKPDIRFVIHRDIPPNIESYYQEAGRAGRDGELARCTLVYRPGDLGRAAFLAGGGELTSDEVIRGHAGLLHQRSGTLRQLESATGLGRADLVRLIAILKEHGIVQELRGRISLKIEDFDPEQIPLEQEAERRAYEKSRLEMMRAYAESLECRRRFLLNYFGEETDSEICGMCDVDRRRSITPVDMSPAEHLPFRVGQRVRHAMWGDGLVHRASAETVIILFERAGYKTLDVQLVLDQQLLQPSARARPTTRSPAQTPQPGTTVSDETRPAVLPVQH
jgi:ATP-dependent DNA helicase RecQ